MRTEREIIKAWQDDTIVVSIICNTFNHQNFLEETLKGFLSQKTNFAFEVLVHDDASTDATQVIIKEYEQDYPLIIKPIYQQENQFSQSIKPFVKFQYPRVKGRYIAICEGDDYWTSSKKLQTQVDFLEKNDDFSISAHAMNVLREDGSLTPFYKQKEVFVLEDFLFANQIGYATASYLFRNTEFLKKTLNSPVFEGKTSGDRLLCITSLIQGKLFFFNEIMGVYRIHDGGIYSKKNWLVKFKMHLKTSLKANDLLGKKYNKQILRFNFKKMFIERPDEVPVNEIYLIYADLEYNKIRKLAYSLLLKLGLSVTPFNEFITKVVFYRF